METRNYYRDGGAREQSSELLCGGSNLQARWFKSGLCNRHLSERTCCPLLVQGSGAQFSWLERVPVTQGVAHKSCDYFWQEIGIG